MLIAISNNSSRKTKTCEQHLKLKFRARQLNVKYKWYFDNVLSRVNRRSRTFFIGTFRENALRTADRCGLKTKKITKIFFSFFFFYRKRKYGSSVDRGNRGTDGRTTGPVAAAYRCLSRITEIMVYKINKNDKKKNIYTYISTNNNIAGNRGDNNCRKIILRGA